MARRSRSLSLPGRPSRFPLMEKNIALSKRKQVHWSTDLEEVIYFAPDSAIMRRDGSALRTFDRRVRMLRARSSSTLNKRLPLKASQTLARSINDANSMLIRTGVNILTHQFDRLKNRSDSLDMFDEQSNSRWKELLALYQKRMRDQLDEQEEEWVWGFEWVFGLHARSVLLVGAKTYRRWCQCFKMRRKTSFHHLYETASTNWMYESNMWEKKDHWGTQRGTQRKQK